MSSLTSYFRQKHCLKGAYDDHLNGSSTSYTCHMPRTAQRVGVCMANNVQTRPESTCVVYQEPKSHCQGSTSWPSVLIACPT